MNRIAEPILTIFTPTYNRAHTLPRTYESLCRQNCKNFIWLIVDDGSADKTAELVRDWQSRDNGFEIQYIYKENGGMHTAHNAAYANIHTELNTCIDSDDMLAVGAVEKILRKWAEIKDKGYAGIVGLDADFEGKIIGKDFPAAVTETTLSGTMLRAAPATRSWSTARISSMHIRSTPCLKAKNMSVWPINIY